MSDPFGRAIRDFHRDELEEPLQRYDGEEVEESHPIERFYFTPFNDEYEENARLADHLQGPLVDLGCGVGRHALYFQKLFDVVAVEVSEHLVETARARGVEDARVGDMFALREQFDRDRFGSALSVGTQLGLAGSVRSHSAFLGDLAHVTRPDATAVVDQYDPTDPDCTDLLGYRADPTTGLAYRVFHFEYQGDVGPTLLFRLLSPDRLREAAIGTGWTVVDVQTSDSGSHYRAFLEKS
jgi:SAM-dependent methyltransferase